jgi:hypothetical protein
VDLRLMAELKDQQGGRIIDSQDEVGGYPTLPVSFRGDDWDTDSDGIPNWWEQPITALNSQLADNNGDWNGNGYTNLEEYLHYSARGGMIPEPTSWLLAAWAGIGLLTVRSRRQPRRVDLD